MNDENHQNTDKIEIIRFDDGEQNVIMPPPTLRQPKLKQDDIGNKEKKEKEEKEEKEEKVDVITGATHKIRLIPELRTGSELNVQRISTTMLGDMNIFFEKLYSFANMVQGKVRAKKTRKGGNPLWRHDKPGFVGAKGKLGDILRGERFFEDVQVRDRKLMPEELPFLKRQLVEALMERLTSQMNKEMTTLKQTLDVPRAFQRVLLSLSNAVRMTVVKLVNDFNTPVDLRMKRLPLRIQVPEEQYNIILIEAFEFVLREFKEIAKPKKKEKKEKIPAEIPAEIPLTPFEKALLQQTDEGALVDSQLMGIELGTGSNRMGILEGQFNEYIGLAENNRENRDALLSSLITSLTHQISHNLAAHLEENMVIEYTRELGPREEALLGFQRRYFTQNFDQVLSALGVTRKEEFREKLAEELLDETLWVAVVEAHADIDRTPDLEQLITQKNLIPFFVNLVFERYNLATKTRSGVVSTRTRLLEMRRLGVAIRLMKRALGRERREDVSIADLVMLPGKRPDIFNRYEPYPWFRPIPPRRVPNN